MLIIYYIPYSDAINIDIQENPIFLIRSKKEIFGVSLIKIMIKSSVVPLSLISKGYCLECCYMLKYLLKIIK